MRKPQITRNMESTKCIALCLDVESGNSVQKSFVVPRHHENNEKLLKLLKAEHDTDTVKIVVVKSVSYDKKKYAMSEGEFLAHAVAVDVKPE